ncbi:MAG: hypothetical protein ACK4QW_14770 [Alphaproteobacteria bacterium]
MLRRFVVAGLIMLGILSASNAYAQGRQNFILINKTGYTIEEVYVGPTKSDDWGDDILGPNLLETNRSLTVTFPKRAGTCRWDIKVVYDDAEEAEWYDFDLCRISRITIFYNQKSGETWAEYD